MQTSRGPLLRRHTLLVVVVTAAAAAMALPLAAGGKKHKPDPPELAVCWQEMQRIFDRQPSEADRGFVFGYVETTLRAQWDPAKGIEEEPCYPDGLRRIPLRTSTQLGSASAFANGCERGPGFVFLASNLAPGELVITDVPYSVRGMDFYLTLPEPIRVEVAPAAAVFVGSFRIVAGPLYPNDPHPPELPTVTLQAIEEPTAAELAVELAPIFQQAWRKYLEATIPAAERRKNHG
jgi:hypothetical protein